MAYSFVLKIILAVATGETPEFYVELNKLMAQ